MSTDIPRAGVRDGLAGLAGLAARESTGADRCAPAPEPSALVAEAQAASDPETGVSAGVLRGLLSALADALERARSGGLLPGDEGYSTALQEALDEVTRERSMREAAEYERDDFRYQLGDAAKVEQTLTAERDAALARAERAEDRYRAAERKATRAEEELQRWKDSAEKWCGEVDPEDASLRDLVFAWGMTDTRGTTPFRELGGSVVQQLVRLVVAHTKPMRDRVAALEGAVRAARDFVSELCCETVERRMEENERLALETLGKALDAAPAPAGEEGGATAERARCVAVCRGVEEAWRSAVRPGGAPVTAHDLAAHNRAEGALQCAETLERLSPAPAREGLEIRADLAPADAAEVERKLNRALGRGGP